jgi:simple sugar transport system permease protein
MQAADVPIEPTRTLRKVGLLGRIFSRAEASSFVGLVLSYTFFAILAGDVGFTSADGVANVVNVATTFGIVAAPVTLLLIAGEFDLSVGSMVGLSSMVYALLLTHDVSVGTSAVITLLICLGFGFLNGFIVVRSGLPSFIVTLAALFSVRGLAIALPLTITDKPVIGGLLNMTGNDPIAAIFAAPLIGQFRAGIFWWLGLSALCWYLLTRTQFGNWIYGVGGSNLAAKELGVPVGRVKIVLFMGTALAAGILSLVEVNTVGGTEALRGQGAEFEAAITAVIGGTLLYGGFGSPIGTVLGALTLATVKQGLFFIGIDASWYSFVLGGILLVAVLANNVVLRRTMGTRR